MGELQKVEQTTINERSFIEIEIDMRAGKVKATKA